MTAMPAIAAGARVVEMGVVALGPAVSPIPEGTGAARFPGSNRSNRSNRTAAASIARRPTRTPVLSGTVPAGEHGRGRVPLRRVIKKYHSG